MHFYHINIHRGAILEISSFRPFKVSYHGMFITWGRHVPKRSSVYKKVRVKTSFKITLSIYIQFWQSGVPTWGSSLRRIPKLCNLSLVKAESLQRSSQISDHYLTYYSTPSIGRISNIFQITGQGRVICWSLIYFKIIEFCQRISVLGLPTEK